MSNQPSSEKPGQKKTDPAAEKDVQGAGGPAVAKEDVNVPNSGKKAKEVPPESKPKKKPGSRLMDYTG